MTGGLTSSVVSIMRTAPWHAAGITRAGVRVGIIDFFNGDKWTAQQNAGEVPVASGTFCRNSEAACSDGIHRRTVTATPSLRRSTTSRPVCRSTSPPRHDQRLLRRHGLVRGQRRADREPLAGLSLRRSRRRHRARSTRSSTTPPCWPAIFNAGNEGSAQYWRGTWVDANGNGYLDFAPGDETLDVTGACVSSLGVRWNDWGPPSTRTNYGTRRSCRGRPWCGPGWRRPQPAGRSTS